MKRIDNIPPLDAKIETGKGPWRVTRDRNGKLLMIEVWVDTPGTVGAYVMLRDERWFARWRRRHGRRD